ncbi:UDP-glycosyltransferase 76B1-like [Aristolochia californica]|uniref:UDP-glycosyltransferase 76B1-like n=1 Tax=Aristolochia californica TaxID=171875 RepID=UPI0035D775DB
MTMAREEEKQEFQGRGPRLVLFPCPLEGHLNPMLYLAYLLHSKGFSISIVHTKFNSPIPSNHQDFHFVPIDDGSPEKQAATEDLMGLIKALNVICAQPFHDRVAEMLAEGPITCLISDALLHFTQAVADRFQLPRIIFRTSSITSFLTCAAFPVLRQKGYLPIRDPQSEAMVSELPPLRVKDLPNIGTDKVDSLYQLVSNMINETKTCVGVISNSFDYLETTSLVKIRQEFNMPIFPIGPLHKYSLGSSGTLLTQDRSCMTWLQQQAPDSVIYVSLGSLVVLNERELAEMAWGLANSMQSFLWVVRPGSVLGSEEVELPKGFEETTMERGRIVHWAPQPEVLAHSAVGGFLTHCGWNSTVESVSEGVPMLCWPCFGDQRVNARFVSHVWKIGLPLENGLNRTKIEKGIRRLMMDREGKEMRERAKILKAEAGNCLKNGGSSFEALHSLVSHILSL